MDILKTDDQPDKSLSEMINSPEETVLAENFEVVIKNTDNKALPEPGDNIFSVRKNVAAALQEDNAPLASVVVVGYNNLEKYTKTCVECILKYTRDVDYELILVDNGSSDGTLDYFKAVRHPKKKIVRVTRNVGAFYGGNSGMALAAGAYVVGVSNDVYVTENWLANMLACAMSDERIGMIGPMSNNISNFQDAGLHFTDFSDMQEKAGEFNVSNPAGWHERIRLVSPIAFFKKTCLDMVGSHDYGFLHDFADDDMTFRVRRAGYKAILCKDVFVCHAGHSAGRTAEQVSYTLEKGRNLFRDKYYGIDAWTDVNNYEPAMMLLINPEDRRGRPDTEILGIDVLCGTPILEVKNKLRDADIFDARLSALSTEAKYWLDLKTICRGKVAVDRAEHLLEHFQGNKFDYIVLGRPINGYKGPYRLLGEMLELLNNGGHLLLKLRNTYGIRTLVEMMGNGTESEKDVFSHIALEALLRQVENNGYKCRALAVEAVNVDGNTSLLIRKVINQFNRPCQDNIFQRLMVNNYVLDVTK